MPEGNGGEVTRVNGGEVKGNEAVKIIKYALLYQYL